VVEVLAIYCGTLTAPATSRVPVLRSIIDVGFDRVRDVQTQVAELLTKGLSGNSQQPGRLVLVASGEVKDAGK
jgi:hypothetical protein